MSVRIQVEGLRKSYFGTEVLHGVSFQVAPQEFTLLAGPSGSGKTTLLNLAAGLDAPDSGKVSVGDVVVTGLNKVARARFRSSVGLVFQRSGLLGGLTARENIEVGHILTRQTLEQSWLTELTTRLGVSDVLDAPATRLSGGQAQRIALARALAHRPAVLFADEPSASLDTASKHDIHALLRSMAHEQGMTVLMVSHDAISPGYADRVLTLDGGSITCVSDGGSVDPPSSPEQVAERPAVGLDMD